MVESISSLSWKFGIPEAIAESQRSKKLFVVYISGGNDESIRVESDTWTDDSVASFVSKYCILVHIVGGSADATHFSAIYPQNSLPSITVVGFHGVKLWQIDGFIKAGDLASNLEKARLSLLMQETTAAVLTGALYSSSDPGLKETTGTAETSSSPSVQESGSKDDETKALQYHDEKKEIGDEVRGNEGIKSSEISRLQDDLGCTSASDSPNYGGVDSVNIKKLDAVESENIKEVDAVNYEKNYKSFENGLQSEPVQPSQTKDLVHENLVKNSTDVSLSIRLPSGSTLLEKFESSEKLRIVKQYVDNKGMTIGNYDLAIPYPRKVFHDQDLDKSLAELNLLNRQGLIIVPRHRASYFSGDNPPEPIIGEQSNDSGGYFSFVKRLFSFFNPFSYFRTSESSDSSSDDEPKTQDHDQDNRYSQNSSSSIRNREGVNQRRPYGSNIHTLRHDEEENDLRGRNSFWNGNSTQYGGGGDNR